MLHCNMSAVSYASRHTDALWRRCHMEIVGIVMLGSVALWIMHEIDSRT